MFFLRSTFRKIPFLKAFSVSAFIMIFNAVASFASFSLLTHYLSEKDYGIINLYNSVIFLILPFIAIGTQFTLNVEFYKLNNEEYKVYFKNAITVSLSSTFLFTILFALFYAPLNNSIQVGYFYIFILPITCFLALINEIIIYLMRNKQKHLLFTAFGISRNFIEFILIIPLVFLITFQWQHRLMVTLIALFISGFFAFFLIQRLGLMSSRFSKKVIKKIFLAGLPFIPERLSLFALSFSDRFFIDHYNGIKNVGIFGVGAQIAFIINMLTLILNNTFHPVIYSALKNESDQKKLRNATLGYFIIAIPMCLITYLLIPVIFKLFIGQKFQDGQIFAGNLILANIFWCIYNAFIPYILFLRKNKLIMWISIIGIILSVTLNFTCIRYYGVMGATYSRIGVYLFMSILLFLAVAKYYNVRSIFSFR